MRRSSRLAHWVNQGGFEGPRLERLTTSINYATGLFERPDQLADLEVTSVLAIFTPETAVVMFTGFEGRELTARAHEIGATDFVEKSIPLDQLPARLVQSLESAPGRVTWMFGRAPDGLAEDVRRAGGTFAESGLDPLADLVRAQLVAGAIARRKGLDPDNPRSLTRSVVLT